MSDNVVINQGAGGPTIACDYIGDIYHQRVKVQHGADGSATDVSIASPLPTRDILFDIGLGNVSGYSVVHKFGSHPDLDSAEGSRIIWNNGVGDAVFTGFDFTAAKTVDVNSTSANDASGGSGAQTVTVYGLGVSGSNWVEQSETFTLTGLSNVTLSNTYIRIHRATVDTAGAGGENDGDIEFFDQASPTDFFAAIPAGYNQTMQAAYTIPSGKTGYLLGWFASLARKTTGNVEMRLRARPNGGVHQVKEEMSLFGAGSSILQRNYPIPKGTYAAKTDLAIWGDSDTNNMGCAAGFDLLLVDD